MRKYLIAGLVILLPVILTIMVVVFLFNFFTSPLAPLVEHLMVRFSLPETMSHFLSRLFSLIVSCLFILFLGFITRYFLFKSLMQFGNHVLLKIPFVKSIYKISREVILALVSPDGKKAFQEAVIMPFPDKPHYCMGFSAGPAAEECQRKTGKKLIAVFAPTAPHPISGFLFLVDPADVKKLDMTKEDALKYLVSCGVIIPEEK
jgi:uncharacterized membrane protein